MGKIQPLTGEPKSGETGKAIQACNDYLRLGPGRSLQKLYQTYTRPVPENPPTKHIATLKEWSRLYGWQERASLYDAEAEEQKTAYADTILKTGLALVHERVFMLKELAHSLAEEIWDEDGGLREGKVWLRDVKQIGSGKDAKEIKLVRFNHHLFEHFRGALDDIAKETGGRKQQLEHSGPGGKPIQTEDVTLDDQKRAEKMVNLLRRIKERANGSG